MTRPILIGHRGASGHLPEHTLAAYALAVLQGADFIEPDLVSTRDGVLVARHENEIGGTTDVAAHPQFADRRRTQRIDGVEINGWFTEDFTHAELQGLRARERIAQLRPGNTEHDGQFCIPAFDEILTYLAQVNTVRTLTGLPPVGVYPEVKHPSHFASIGLQLEPPLLAALKAGQCGAPVVIQSFEVGNLQWLRRACDYPLVQLMMAEGGPWDRRTDGAMSYAAMTTAQGLARVADYADIIGVDKSMVLNMHATPPRSTGLVARAHAAGLAVHVWTFRAENAFLPARLRLGNEDDRHGDLGSEINAFLAEGIDGLFADQPGLVLNVLNQAIAATGIAVANPRSN